MNGCIPPDGTLADCGETEMLIGTSAVGTVIATDANFVVSATEVAVRLTIKVTPGGPGAVYVIGAPLAVMLGDTTPHVAPLQVMAQDTPFPDGSFLTVAVNCVVASGGTVNAASERETLMGGGGGGTLTEPPQPELLATIAATRDTIAARTQRLGDMTNLLAKLPRSISFNALHAFPTTTAMAMLRGS